MGEHLIDGEFQSDKYNLPPNVVGLSLHDDLIRPKLKEYASAIVTSWIEGDDDEREDVGFALDISEAIWNIESQEG